MDLPHDECCANVGGKEAAPVLTLDRCYGGSLRRSVQCPLFVPRYDTASRSAYIGRRAGHDGAPALVRQAWLQGLKVQEALFQRACVLPHSADAYGDQRTSPVLLQSFSGDGICLQLVWPGERLHQLLRERSYRDLAGRSPPLAAF